MGSTIVITGANGSRAIPAVEHALLKYPDYTLILTVRNTSANDVNTQRLQSVLTKYPNNKSSIIKLDLANLSAVQDFAQSTVTNIATGTIPPLATIVCDAY